MSIANLVTSADYNTKLYQLNGLSDVGTAFDDFATFQQNDILLRLLGQTLYSALSAGVAALPALWSQAATYAIGNEVIYNGVVYASLVNANLGNEPDQTPLAWSVTLTTYPVVLSNRWQAIYYGANYTDPNTLRVYNYQGLKAMMVPYIYAMWLEDQATQITAMGNAVAPASENSGAASQAVKISQAFDDFTELAGDPDDQTTITNVGSLYGFLVANDAIYFPDVSVEGDTNLFMYLNFHFMSLGGANEFDL